MLSKSFIAGVLAVATLLSASAGAIASTGDASKNVTVRNENAAVKNTASSQGDRNQTMQLAICRGFGTNGGWSCL